MDEDSYNYVLTQIEEIRADLEQYKCSIAENEIAICIRTINGAVTIEQQRVGAADAKQPILSEALDILRSVHERSIK